MKKWLLLCSKARQETTAVENLKRQGFVAYTPFISANRTVKNGSNRARSVPLFPNYLFLQVDPEVQSIAPVRSTRGVLTFVRFGEQYAWASDLLVEQIRETAARTTAREPGNARFEKGEKVKVNRKGFEDVEAIFSASCGKERVTVLMSILGRETAITLPVDCISKTV